MGLLVYIQRRNPLAVAIKRHAGVEGGIIHSIGVDDEFGSIEEGDFSHRHGDRSTFLPAR
jgi:anti-sigma factor ChrR (cupin superfamily)